MFKILTVKLSFKQEEPNQESLGLNFKTFRQGKDARVSGSYWYLHKSYEGIINMSGKLISCKNELDRL